MQQTVSALFKLLAQLYVRLKRPIVIAVAGSVGKTSTKLMLAEMLRSTRVSYMDDSYNNGIGLYLSVFELKIPQSLRSPLAWLKLFAKAIVRFFGRGPEFMILEYGIDKPGDMDAMIHFIRPDIALLTAITPEHMEFLKTLDGVASEETKILHAAKQFAVYNSDDVAATYVDGITTKMYTYGYATTNDASYRIDKWTNRGARITATIHNTKLTATTQFISEPLVRQLIGAALLAHHLGVDTTTIATALERATPAASRMRLFAGANGSTLIDDTTNFSPNAGIEALKALKRLPGKRHIAILGNMHELGDFADEGFSAVSKEFDGLDIIALVGEISQQYFTPLAEAKGFMLGKNLFHLKDAVDAGNKLREKLTASDVVLVKGPFGGWYMEEAVKQMLANKQDAHKLTRQSPFWQQKKRAHFGDKYTPL